MNKWVKYTFGLIVLLTVLFGCTTAAIAETPTAMVSVSDTSTNPKVTESDGSNTVENPGTLEQFGPPGVIVSGLLGGALLVVRAWRDGRKIDVTTYKERAAEAETRSNEEIGKVRKKLDELEAKLDTVIEDRDKQRDTLEERKAQFTAQILDLEKRHQRELEDMHAALLIEIHVRHSLERLLAENGISIPQGAPVYTTKMKADAQAEMDVTTQALRVIRESE